MKRFAPVCTLPEAGPVFVSNPNVRSTLDIVWTCVSILILCSWSVLHLTVPAQFSPQNWRQRWNLWIARLALKLKWMLITIIAPEIIYGSAATGWYSARRNTPDLQRFAEQDGVPWSKAHTSFADIGGFVLRFDNDENAVAPGASDLMRGLDQTEELQQLLPDGRNSTRLRSLRNRFRAMLADRTRRYGTPPWRPHKTHESHAAEALALATARQRRDQDSTSVILMEGDTWVLTSDQLYKVRNFGIIPTLPNVTQAELDDKNKGDVLVKLLAIVQVSWMVVQVIVRASLGRPSSPLEIMAMAFAGTTFFFYLLSLDRPQNVNTPIYIYAQRPANADEMATIALDSSNADEWEIRISNDAAPGYINADSSRTVMSTLPHERAYLVAAVISSVIFGGLHLFAWNSPFPTDVEKWLWRVSSLVTMLVPAIILMVYATIFRPGLLGLGDMSSKVFLYTGGLAMIVVRLFMIVEAFRSLYYLPPENYVNTWAANIPHFG